MSEFRIVRGELPKLNNLAIERAVKAFVAETGVSATADPLGFFRQTIGNIHAAVYRGMGDFWLVEEDGEVAGYMLGHVANEVDGELTYWLAQAYVAPSFRGKPAVKEWWQAIRQKAKDYFCKHIVVVSSRGSDAYCRFLGQGWHEYARLLKEDI